MVSEYEALDEKFIYKKTHNGLPVYILNKKGINTFYTALLVNFGSIDLKYKNVISKKEYSVIQGTAHFLEHKLFESKDESTFEMFSKNSASVNAYTNLTSTVYYFYCTDRIETNLKAFLNLVQNPYITDENVNKEKDIIIQEINMYNDNPYWKAYNNFLDIIYSVNNAKYDVAGTVNDIGNITKESIMGCYNDFYISDNMALFIVGDIDNKDILKVIDDSWYIKCGIQKIKRMYSVEPDNIVKNFIAEKFDIKERLFVMGFKEKNNYITKKNILFKEVAQKIILEYLLGSASPVYEKLYDENYIDSTLSYGTNIYYSFFFNIISGSSKNPEYVKEKLIDELNIIKNSGFNNKSIENIKKMLTGSYIKSLDDENVLLNNLCQYYNKGSNFFDIHDVVNKISTDEIFNEFKQTFLPENFCLSIIEG